MITRALGNIYSSYFSSNRIELIWKLAQIDFKKRYYNDKLGMLWALLNPILQVAIYYFVFKYVLQRGQDDFALFLFAGLIFWTTFMIGTKQGINIFKMKRYLIENIQFNKIDLFISHCISVSLGFMFNLLAFTTAALLYGVTINILFTLWALPLIILIVLSLIFGCSLILSTLSITFKDINHIWDFVLLCGFWTAGMFFPAARILDKFPAAKYINPFLGIVENARRLLMYNTALDIELLVINICQAIITILLGLIVFRNYSSKALERL